MNYSQVNSTPVLLNVGRAWHDGDWNFRNVSSPFTRIHYVTGGSARIIREKGPIELRPGHMYLTPPYTCHSYENDGPFSLYYLHIYFTSTAPAGLLEWLDLPAEVPSGDESERIFRRLVALHPGKSLKDFDPRWYDNDAGLARNLADSSLDSLAVAMETEGLIRQLLARFLLDASSRVERLDPRITAAIQYIGSHLEEKISLSVLSEVASLSKDHFIRLFTRELEMTPGRYINRRKIEAAQLRLLLSPAERVKSVAYSLGFDNLSYFNRLFLKLTGESPGRYRESRRQSSLDGVG